MCDSDINRFNKQVSSFLESLHKILPDNKEIYIFKTQVDTMSMINKKFLLENFILYVYPYKDQIMKKDEKFFLNDDLNVEEDQIEHAIHLKSLWKEKLTDKNKEVVWKFFQVLILLAERIKNNKNNKK